MPNINPNQVKQVIKESLTTGGGWEVMTDVYHDTPAAAEGINLCVFAKKNQSKLAVKLIDASVSYDQVKACHQVLSAANIRCVWFRMVSNDDTELSDGFELRVQDIPVFNLSLSRKHGYRVHNISFFNDSTALSFSINDNDYNPVGFTQVHIDIDTFFALLLGKVINFKREYEDSLHFKCQIMERDCWRCHNTVSAIGNIIYIREMFGEAIPEDQAQSADIRSIPQSEINLINQLVCPKYGINALKPMYSHTMKTSYMANSCSCCGAILGAFFELTTSFQDHPFSEVIESSLDPRVCFDAEADGVPKNKGEWILDIDYEITDKVLFKLLLENAIDISSAQIPLWFSYLALPPNKNSLDDDDFDNPQISLELSQDAVKDGLATNTTPTCDDAQISQISAINSVNREPIVAYRVFPSGMMQNLIPEPNEKPQLTHQEHYQQSANDIPLF